MFKLFKKTPDILLKEATSKKKNGDLKSAIDLLKEAYKKIGNTPIGYSVNIFLRLPLYLQEAKRDDEAWREFNLLLTKGYPNQMKYLDLVLMDNSIIYDKMRLYLQRKGKSELAIKFGILSYLYWATGLYKQKRNDELKTYVSKENIEKIIRKLLKKAAKINSLEKLSIIVEEQIKYLPNIDFGELAKKIDSVIF